MMNFKKISIAFLMSSTITIIQAMEYHDTSTDISKIDTHTVQAKELPLKITAKNPPESIKSELSRAKLHKNSIAQENSAQEINKIALKETVLVDTSHVSHQKVTPAHEINFKNEPQASTKSVETNINYAGFDLPSVEKKSVITEKDIAPIVHESVSEKAIENKIDATIEDLFKKSMLFPDVTRRSLEEIIASSLHDLLFHILGLSEQAQAQQPTESFKSELQYLSQQIQKFSNATAYTDIDQMIEFIIAMNDFLKQSHIVPLSDVQVENIDTAYTTAFTAANIFKNQNLIFDFNLVPDEVIQIFKQPIDDGQNLIKIKDALATIHTIYNKEGSINLIMHSWQNFLESKYVSIQNNQYYAAFMTFLLIFQDSMLATISILNETSNEFQVTDQLPTQSISYPA